MDERTDGHLRPTLLGRRRRVDLIIIIIIIIIIIMNWQYLISVLNVSVLLFGLDQNASVLHHEKCKNYNKLKMVLQTVSECMF